MLGQERRLGRTNRQELRDKVLSSLPLGLWPSLGRRAVPWWSLEALSQRLQPWAPAMVLIGLVGSGVLFLVGSGALGRWWGGQRSDLLFPQLDEQCDQRDIDLIGAQDSDPVNLTSHVPARQPV
jgi:hypothetical protein